MNPVVRQLAERIDATIPPLLAGTAPRRIMVLDAPDYPNVGDPAIFLGEMAADVSFTVDDWVANRPGVEKVHGLTRKMMRHGFPAALVARHGLKLFELYARSRLRFGLNLLASGRTVVTDRLHGHILATLINRPRFVFDSLDGKVRAFNETWLSQDPGAVFFDSLEQFRERIGAPRSMAA